MDGEGLSDVYVALAEVMEILLEHRRAPLAIFYDNACALKVFTKNPKRAALSEVARWLGRASFCWTFGIAGIMCVLRMLA